MSSFEMDGNTGVDGVDEEVLVAMRLRQMMQDGFGNEKEEEKPKRKRRKKTEDEHISREYLLPEYRIKLPRYSRVNVKMYNHSILYKNQDWKMPDRDIVYNIMWVKYGAQAERIAEEVGLSKEEQARAKEGDTRWYVVRAAVPVPVEVMIAGYVEVEEVNGKAVIKSIYTNGNNLTKNSMLKDDVEYSIEKEMKKMIEAPENYQKVLPDVTR